MSEFLFSFLVLRFYSQKRENIFFYNEEMKIKLEIANSNLNYYQLFPVFFLFFNNIIIKHIIYLN